MKYSANKDIHELVRALVRQGWHFFRGSKHGRLRAPAGHPVLTIPGSPSDMRSFKNLRQDLRKAMRTQT